MKTEQVEIRNAAGEVVFKATVEYEEGSQNCSSGAFSLLHSILNGEDCMLVPFDIINGLMEDAATKE